MNTLFSECYGDGQKPADDANQTGCGFANIGTIALEPLMNEIKKGILNASQAVIRQMRKKQVGSGKKKKKKIQVGKGRVAKKKPQTGKGRAARKKKSKK